MVIARRLSDCCFGWTTWSWRTSVWLMLVGFAEGLGAAKSYAARAQYEIDANLELLGVGAANLAAGFSSGMVVKGSLSKTAVNGSAGARTQLSGVTVAGLTIVTLLFFTGLFEDLPEATLAAVVIAAVIELVDIHALVRLYRIFTGPPSRFGIAIRPDFVAAIAAMLGVLVFDTLPLFIGIAVSLLLLIYRASAPHVAEPRPVPGTPGHYTDLARHDDNERVPGVVVVRPESGLFFANADHVRNEIRARVSSARPHTVVLDAETVPFVHVTAISMLEQLSDELARDDVGLVIARDLGAVRDVLGRAGEPRNLRVYPTVQAAVDAALGRQE